MSINFSNGVTRNRSLKGLVLLTDTFSFENDDNRFALSFPKWTGVYSLSHLNTSFGQNLEKHKTAFRVKKNKPYPGIWNNFWLASQKIILTTNIY